VIVFLFLAAVSLRSWGEFDAKFEALFEPARLLANLAAPLSWVSRGEVRAEGVEELAAQEARRAEGRAVLLAAQSRAAPREDVLARGRGLVHAEVFGYVEDNPDNRTMDASALVWNAIIAEWPDCGKTTASR